MTVQVNCKRTLALWTFLLLTAETTAGDRVNLFTIAESQTQTEIGRDIGRYIAEPIDVRFGLVRALGPADTLLNLQKELGWSLAILPLDALVTYANLAEHGNADANQLLSPVRVIAPLFANVIYFVVRQDSEYYSFSDIQNARINIGPQTGTTAVSVGSLYRLLFDKPIPDANLSMLSHEDALIDLITEKRVDVVAIVGDQPLKLLADMKPEARQYIRLLKFDASHPGSKGVFNFYSPATIFSANYQNLLLEDQASVAVTQYLVAYRRRVPGTELSLHNFIRSWCKNSARMKAEGNVKWRTNAAAGDPEASRKLPTVDFGVCAKDSAPNLQPVCKHEQRALGLCR